MPIALAAMGSDRGLKKRNGHNPLFTHAILLGAATRRSQFHVFLHARRELLSLVFGENRHDVAALQAGPAPVKPTVLFSGELAEFNVLAGGGGQLSVLPTRDGHGGTVQFSGQFALRDSQFLAETSDLLGPFRGCVISSFPFGHSHPLLRDQR
jgi:hypothetical protein